jgi:uncharacterized membrane protein YdcZ (DUF606 family)
MKLLFFGCLALGSLTVFQPLLNRMIAEQRGLGIAAWTNGLVLLVISSVLVIAIYFWSDHSPEILALKSGAWHWYYIFPGLMGFALVVGMPLMMRALGAFPTIVTFLCGQLLTSFIWDIWANNQLPSGARILGLIFALLGTYLTIRPAF